MVSWDFKSKCLPSGTRGGGGTEETGAASAAEAGPRWPPSQSSEVVLRVQSPLPGSQHPTQAQVHALQLRTSLIIHITAASRHSPTVNTRGCRCHEKHDKNGNWVVGVM